MSVITRPHIEYYYDSHLTEEDLMSYNELQDKLARYLLDVLDWLFHIERWYNALDLNLFITRHTHEVPTVPDVAVIRVVLEDDRDDFISSWYIEPPESPPPAIVFEIASKKTWVNDLDEKPEKYARMGVKEYVYFDPRPRRPRRSPHMRVWRTTDGVPVELPANEHGWVWSEELQSWLVPEGRLLRLYERNGEMRPTEAQARYAEAAAERAEKERERAAKEAAIALKERAWAELRRLGIDPESLS